MRLLIRVVFNVFLGLSCKVNKLRLHTKVSKVKIPLDVSKIMGKIFFVCQLRMVNKQILDYQFVPVGGNLLKIQNRRNTSHFGAHMLKVDKANNFFDYEYIGIPPIPLKAFGNPRMLIKTFPLPKSTCLSQLFESLRENNEIKNP